jgi:hypothetical protein
VVDDRRLPARNDRRGEGDLRDAAIDAVLRVADLVDEPGPELPRELGERSLVGRHRRQDEVPALAGRLLPGDELPLAIRILGAAELEVVAGEARLRERQVVGGRPARRAALEPPAVARPVEADRRVELPAEAIAEEDLEGLPERGVVPVGEDAPRPPRVEDAAQAGDVARLPDSAPAGERRAIVAPVDLAAAVDLVLAALAGERVKVLDRDVGEVAQAARRLAELLPVVVHVVVAELGQDDPEDVDDRPADPPRRREALVLEPVVAIGDPGRLRLARHRR